MRPFLGRVTERHIGYLEKCYRDLGFRPEEARHRAYLVYAARAGTVRLFRDLPDRTPRGEDHLAYRGTSSTRSFPERMREIRGSVESQPASVGQFPRTNLLGNPPWC